MARCRSIVASHDQTQPTHTCATQEDCEDPECHNPLSILSRALAATMDGKMSEQQKANFLRAAKLDEWRTANCPLDKNTLGRGTWGLVKHEWMGVKTAS